MLLREQWFGSVKADVLSGTVVALALIPEAIAFSIIAGVDPQVGLFASFTIAVITSIAGGRPGMISAATGAMALVIVDLVKDHGIEYLFLATIVAGLVQLIFSGLRVASLMRFIPVSVVVGFVNALAILIFMAQLPELISVPWVVYALVAGGLAIIYLLPRITKAVPSPLIAIIVVSVVAIIAGFDVRAVGDMGELPSSLPFFRLPDVPLSWDTLMIVLPYSVTLAVVGLLEAFMTAEIVDELSDTSSNRHQEGFGQGLANVVTGFFGGMAGCAMIGQSVINVKSGGRGRLSAFIAGTVLLTMVVFAGPWVAQIPMAALVSVMIMVSIGTFKWSSIRDIRTNPKSATLVMASTVIVVVATHDLAQGVLVGVLISTVFFAHKVGRILAISSETDLEGRVRTYRVFGQVFFASSTKFTKSFDVGEVIDKVCIDVSHSHFWDLTAVRALDNVVMKFRREDTEVEIIGLNEASATLIDRFAVHDKPEAIESLMGN